MPRYGQCGGKAYSGSTCCADGWTCFENNAWHSQCLEACPDGWACKGIINAQQRPQKEVEVMEVEVRLQVAMVLGIAVEVSNTMRERRRRHRLTRIWRCREVERSRGSTSPTI